MRGLDRRVISWLRTADAFLGLFPYQDLADDAHVGSPSRGSFDGVTMAMNVESEDIITEALETAESAGATILRPLSPTEFGATSYFEDPDGYVWEVAYSPAFPIERLSIP